MRKKFDTVVHLALLCLSAVTLSAMSGIFDHYEVLPIRGFFLTQTAIVYMTFAPVCVLFNWYYWWIIRNTDGYVRVGEPLVLFPSRQIRHKIIPLVSLLSAFILTLVSLVAVLSNIFVMSGLDFLTLLTICTFGFIYGFLVTKYTLNLLRNKRFEIHF